MLEVLSYDMVSGMFKAVHQPLLDIRDLTISVESTSVPLFVANLKYNVIGLRYLNISIDDNTFNPLPDIYSLETLESLHILHRERWE